MTQMPLFPDLEEEKEYLPQVIPANLSPKQVSAEEQKTLATSGRTYLELFNKNDLMYAFSKMLVATFPLDLMKFSMTWKVKATQQGRLYCQLKRVVHRTEEIGSGLSDGMWMTPTTINVTNRGEQSLARKKEIRNKSGRKTVPPGTLAEQVSYGFPIKDMMMWPTPQANESGRKLETWKKAQKDWAKKGVNLQVGLPQAVQMWPTPTTKGYGHGSEGQYQNLYNKMMQGIITQKELEIMTATKMENHRSYKKMQKMWATPRSSPAMSQKITSKLAQRGKGNLEEQVAQKMWMTQTARDYKDSGNISNWKENRVRSSLPRQVHKEMFPQITHKNSLVLVMAFYYSDCA